MSSLLLGPRDRRVLWVGLVSVAAILGAGRGVPRLRLLYAEERAAAIEQRSVSAAAERAIAVAPALEDSLRSLDSTMHAWRGRLFAGVSLNAAAASAVSHLGALAREHRAAVGAIQVQRDSSARGGLVRVTLSATLTADIHGLARLLAELESGTKLLRVRSLSVSQPNVAGRTEGPETLNVQLVVQALAMEPTR